MSSKGGAVSRTVECSRREERLRERLNVPGKRTGLGKALGLSWLREDARTFLLGPHGPASTSSLLLVWDALDEAEHVSRS